jgi:hypothetical protein
MGVGSVDGIGANGSCALWVVSILSGLLFGRLSVSAVLGC